LEKNAVGIDLVTRDEKTISDLSAIIVDRESGERVIFSNQKANGKLEIVPENIAETEWIFIGDLHGVWEDHLDAIIGVAQEKKIKIAYNPRQANIHDNVEKIIQAASFSEILFVNKDEAIEIASRMEKGFSAEELNSEEFLLKELKKLEARIVALTDGRRGAWATDGEKTFFAKGLVVPAVDSTGAGDAFSSGFMAGYINEKSLEECLQWGIANSASAVQFYGGSEGLLDEEIIQKKIREVSVESV
jgi:sugar/nucleoside kinase (ribokinase family)